MCQKFVGEMQKEFEMTMIGELNFFLGLQVNQNSKDIFISQWKYVREFLKIFGLKNSKSICTPMTTRCKLTNGDKSPKIGASKYQLMIEGLKDCYTWLLLDWISCMLFALQLDFSKIWKRHMVAVNRIFRYLKGTKDFGLWYPKGSNFTLKDCNWCRLGRKCWW